MNQKQISVDSYIGLKSSSLLHCFEG